MTDAEIKLIEFTKFKNELLTAIEKLTPDNGQVVMIFEEQKFCKECGEAHKMLAVLSHASSAFIVKALEGFSARVIKRAMGMDDGNEWGKHKEN